MASQIETNKKNTFRGITANSCSKYPIQMDVHVVLGMPSKNCQFHGICKIEPMPDFNLTLPTHKTQARLVLNESQELEFHFKKSSLTPQITKQHFSTNFFKILEPVELPEFITLALKISFKIETGSYPITTDRENYKVCFGEKKRSALTP